MPNTVVVIGGKVAPVQRNVEMVCTCFAMTPPGGVGGVVFRTGRFMASELEARDFINDGKAIRAESPEETIETDVNQSEQTGPTDSDTDQTADGADAVSAPETATAPAGKNEAEPDTKKLTAAAPKTRARR